MPTHVGWADTPHCYTYPLFQRINYVLFLGTERRVLSQCTLVHCKIKLCSPFYSALYGPVCEQFEKHGEWGANNRENW